uniref:Uncharacterized protein n=1 Tax=Rhizobium leguminosarum TaxID=384 RepID=A0A154I963_RHILE|nr:hypothetical protein A4A59_32850 [Rhizobium leguminosarum]
MAQCIVPLTAIFARAEQIARLLDLVEVKLQTLVYGSESRNWIFQIANFLMLPNNLLSANDKLLLVIHEKPKIITIFTKEFPKISLGRTLSKR